MALPQPSTPHTSVANFAATAGAGMDLSMVVSPFGGPASFADMAGYLLAQANARALVAHVQHKLLRALVAAGFSVGAWQVRDNLEDNEDLVVVASSVRVTDPLSQMTFSTRLRLALRAARAGCIFSMTYEACQLAGREVVVPREPLAFLSWDETELAKRADCFSRALASLAEEPSRLFADSDFDIFARRLTEELAP